MKDCELTSLPKARLTSLLEDIHEYLHDSLKNDNNMIETMAKIKLIERLEEVI